MKSFTLILCSTLPFFASLVYFFPTEPAPWFLNLLGLTKLFLFLCPFLFWKFLKLPGHWKDFSKLIFNSNIKRQLLIGLGTGALMCLAVLGTYEVISEASRNEALSRIAKKISVLKISEHFLLYGIVLSFLHSLLEEFYWRFFIFNAWKKQLVTHNLNQSIGNVGKSRKQKLPIDLKNLLRSAHLAHLIAGLAFTLHHFTVTVHYFDLSIGIILGLGVWAGGVIWSYTYEKERSLLGVWISHIIVDLALISVGFRALS